MWQPEWKESLGENVHIHMYGWVPLLYTWDYHNIDNHYTQFKLKSLIKSIKNHTYINNFSPTMSTYLTLCNPTNKRKNGTPILKVLSKKQKPYIFFHLLHPNRRDWGNGRWQGKQESLFPESVNQLVGGRITGIYI